MPVPSIAEALRLGMDLKDFRQRQDLNSETIKARQYQNALVPEERAYQQTIRGQAQEDRRTTLSDAEVTRKRAAAKFGAEMVEKTLPQVLPESYPAWRETAMKEWSVPDRFLPDPSIFNGPEGLEKFKLWNGKMFEKALELQGKTETAQIAADRARETAQIGADSRIKAAEIGATRGKEVAQIGADSRIEAAKIRRTPSPTDKPGEVRRAAKDVANAEELILSNPGNEAVFSSQSDIFNRYAEKPYIYKWGKTPGKVYGTNAGSVKVALPKINGKQVLATDVYATAQKHGITVEEVLERIGANK